MQIKCVVSCRDANGTPSFFSCVVSCTQAQYDDGDHYSAAALLANENGYEGVGLVYDQNDGPPWLFAHFPWDVPGGSNERPAQSQPGDRHVIRDRDGKPIASGRNQAVVRRYTSTHLVKVVAIDKIGSGADPEAKLMILFEGDVSYEHNWASYCVLCETVRNWRNLHGAPLRVGGQRCGLVGTTNKVLRPLPTPNS
jgi:hypothetical protein